MSSVLIEALHDLAEFPVMLGGVGAVPSFPFTAACASVLTSSTSALMLFLNSTSHSWIWSSLEALSIDGRHVAIGDLRDVGDQARSARRARR